MSCFGSRKKSAAGETEPLLPQYEDHTTLQRQLHQKLHTYQMLRALYMGYMPSTDQAIVNLRTLLSSDLLNPDTPGLSRSTYILLRLTKQGLSELIEALRNKNGDDQIQDFIWYLAHANISVDGKDLVRTAGTAKAKADTAAAFASFKTIGDLLLTNSDFRVFLADLNTIGRQVFADTAHTLSSVAEEAAQQIEPSEKETHALKQPGEELPAAGSDVVGNTLEVADVVTEGLKTAGAEAGESLKQNIGEEQRETLKLRLKRAVLKLRDRPDYSDSVSTLYRLIERYIQIYAQVAEETTTAIEENVEANPELDRAAKLFWSILSSFGAREAWDELDRRFHTLIEQAQHDGNFEQTMKDVADAIQRMLTDPEFYDAPEKKVEELKEKATAEPLRSNLEAVLQQAHTVFGSVINDNDVSKLQKTTLDIWKTLSPSGSAVAADILTDAYTSLFPIFVRSIECIPIPRLELSSPDIDLLLENVILEPGRTIHKSTFFPWRVKIGTSNDLVLTQTEGIFNTTSATTSLLHLTLQGLTVSASSLSYWLRMHSGLLRFGSEGLASFSLDERGIDVSMTLEVSTSTLEQILIPRDVRVTIHRLNYTLSSGLTCFAWLLKPLLRPLLRKLLEIKLRTALTDAIYALNRELVFARERLRAVRVYYGATTASSSRRGSPADLDILSFVRAVTARFSPPSSPPAAPADNQLDVRVGLAAPPVERDYAGRRKPAQNPFAGVYAPGSLLRTWEVHGRDAPQRVEAGAPQEESGWRNDVFDVPVGSP